MRWLAAAGAIALLAPLAFGTHAFAKATRYREPPPGWSQRIGTPPIKCVERSYSISVGNPAFKHRRWPYPCF